MVSCYIVLYKYNNSYSQKLSNDGKMHDQNDIDYHKQMTSRTKETDSCNQPRKSMTDFVVAPTWQHVSICLLFRELRIWKFERGKHTRR